MKFIATPNHTVTSGRQIDYVVIHTAETPETNQMAEAVARYFQKSSVKASAHYCVDNNSEVQCVYEKNVAWAAPGANHNGIQIELAGRAGQSKSDWNDDYSKALLKRAAKLTAQICKRNNIPLRKASNADLKAGRKGIIGHVQASQVFRRSDHWDPGTNFPWDEFIKLVKEAGGEKTTSSPKPSTSTPKATTNSKPTTNSKILKRGSKGASVKNLQKGLNRVFSSYSKLSVDGDFGPATEKVVKEFQRRSKISSDGIVGPRTKKELSKYGIKV